LAPFIILRQRASSKRRSSTAQERVAPGGGVGVEVLAVERVGPKARADAQVGARDRVVGRAVLARDVLDQARAPAHGVRAPCGHGEAKVVDARVVGPGHHASSGRSSGRGSSGHSEGSLVGTNPKGRLFVGVLEKSDTKQS
jgi:hypothetical protein